LLSLLVTFGISLILVNAALRLWSGDYRMMRIPYFEHSLILGPFIVPLSRVVACVVGVGMVAGLSWLLASTRLGRMIRATAQDGEMIMQEYAVPPGSHPHDVAPAPDGTVWYTAQHTGELGRLDPETGDTHHIPLGAGSSPHGVIVGPDGAAWVTDSGLNAIVRVDAETEEVTVYPLPAGSINGNLNTPAFDGDGILWFTGQSGIYGRVDPETGVVEVFDAPRGRGPYGITSTPDGDIYSASLAGSHIARVDLDSGEVTVLEPPTPNQGARRVWSDSQGRIWVSEWNSGNVSVYDPAGDDVR
jgi:virginiamycin B lyase